jgi:hypothetical protein
MHTIRFTRSIPARLLGAALLWTPGLLLVSSMSAQTTAAIDGTVKDTEGAVVPQAQITLIGESSKARRTTVSNGEGYFTINAIQPETYDLIVSEKGFEAYRINGIAIHPGDHQTIAKIALKIGEVTESVTVTANTAGVSLDSPEKSSIITADDIQRLSTVGRDATELIKFLPGFAVSTGGTTNNISTANSAQTMGFGSSSVSSFSANGATPQTGATTVVSDGASTMDPGDMGASIGNVNMDMVQEIKVQTADFGADSAKGPVVINAVGKSGGSNFHGEAYIFSRNTILNANDWYANYNGAARSPSKYYFPGANVGGPVIIPGTKFNYNKKMTFFTAFEDYDQTAPDSNGNGGLLLSFVPTARMLSGDLTPPSIAQALGISAGALGTACPNDYSNVGLANSQGYCSSPGWTGNTYDYQDQLVSNGYVNGVAALPIDARAAIFEKFFPTPNRQPRAGNGNISDGYNYIKQVSDSHNGFQYRARVDENFTDTTKLYVTYNLEAINDETAIDNTYYAGSDIIPYPTQLFSHTKSNQISLNFTKQVGATLTNEAIVSGVYFYAPNQFSNRGIVSDASTGFDAAGPTNGRYYQNGALQLPGILDYEEGVPDFAMGYIPASSAFLRKFSYNAADNLTKQIKTHSVKVGVYAETTANNQVPYNYTQGQYAFNHYNPACITSDGLHGQSPDNGLDNNVANFLQGCSEFTQASNSTPADLHFRTFDFYATDEWKATKRLTLTYGVRFDHLGAWFNPDGIGLAVWNPPAQHVLYSGVTQNAATFPGISWHQTNPSVPLSGQPSRPMFYSPRAGLAYDLYGDGKTTIRGGWGAYRFHDSYNDSAGALSTTIGTQTYTSPSNISCTYDQIARQGAADAAAKGPLPVGMGCPSQVGASGSVGAFSVEALDPHDDKQPVTYNYNFTVDQLMFGDGLLELSYVGNRSADTFTEGNLRNQNFIPLGGLFQPDPLTGTVTQPGTSQSVVQDYRPYPNYTTVYVPNHIGYGNYNSAQISYNKQKGAFIYRVNYTWAKALGIRGDYRTGFVGDPSVLRHNYGYLNFNRNNAVNATYSWQVGHLYKGNRVIGAILNQWEFSGITSLQSGPDINALTGNGNFNLAGGVTYTPPGATAATTLGISNSSFLGTPDINLQPVVTCDPRHNLQNSSTYGHQYFNGSCFALPKLGTNGTFDLPDTHGPAYFDTDLTVQRNFKVRETQVLQFRLSGFNFLNHPLYAFEQSNAAATTLNYALPTGTVVSTPQEAFAAAAFSQASFGYTPFKQGYRIVELGAKYTF